MSGAAIHLPVIPNRREESVHIEPEPTAEEAAAIVAVLLLREPPDEQAGAADMASAWARAGRLAATRGRDGGAAMGWGRIRDGRRR